MYIPAWLIFLGNFCFFFFVISLFVSWRGITLLKFWSIPLAAVLPWIMVLFMVGVWTGFSASGSRAQAMAMSGLYPMFAVFIALILGTIISFFVAADRSLGSRIRWSLIISGIPAVCMALFLVYAFLQ